MLSFLQNYLLSVYLEVIVFFVLLAMLILQHRWYLWRPRGSGYLRLLALLILFFYFLWNWSSEIPESLRNASVFGMLIVNLILLYNLWLNHLEEQYRQVLASYSQDYQNKQLLDEIWRRGKRFIYWRHFFQSLRSGLGIRTFLRGLADKKIPGDIQKILAQQGYQQKLISFAIFCQFLRQRLAAADNLPPAIKTMLAHQLEQFAAHAWFQEQVEEFLRLALTDPEPLYNLAFAELQSRATSTTSTQKP